MRIDRKLNIVTELDHDGGTIYVHSTPIGRVVFETYYKVMAAARAEIFRLGLESITGPRVAHLMVRDAAKAMGMWEGPAGVEAGFFTEIRRLAFVIMPGQGGWTSIPFDVACAQDMLSEDEFSEVMGRICFFTLTSALSPKRLLPMFLSQTNGLWKAQTTLLNSTEYANSLPTSTETASSETSQPAS
jgi:hypothetical protein